MTILVCGGAGYIGSHTCVELLRAGYDVVIADNFSNSSRRVLDRLEQITGKRIPCEDVDVCREDQMEAVFSQWPDIGAVIHFAGLKAVGESVKCPLEYYTNNVAGTLSLLRVMRRHDVRRIIFSSSATVYGENGVMPLREDHPTGGTTNPYGTTKWFVEKILQDCCAADKGLRAAVLRYFNPIGAHESGLIGEDPQGIPNNLLPYIARVAVGRLEKLHVFGDDYPTRDGTGVRDYVHVVDLAKGHVAALKKLEEDCGLFVCNLGTGTGYSVMEVLRAYEKASGRTIPYVVDPRRPGDVAECWADPEKARREMGWRAELGLDEMCASSWKWQSMNPNGYED